MKKELYNQLTDMCQSCDVSPRIECMILDLMQDAYYNGWEDGRSNDESLSPFDK
jgi:hypothetical protein